MIATLSSDVHLLTLAVFFVIGWWIGTQIFGPRR